MKKFIKIILLYLLFGVIIALAVTFGGAYTGLVINSGLGHMSMWRYTSLMSAVIIGWVPVLISSTIFHVIPCIEIIAAVVFIVFIVLCLIIIKSKNH